MQQLLRRPDEREVNRIKPNPNLRMQPIFLNPAPSKKPSKSKQPSKNPVNGLCLEITGRVQDDYNELKYFMTDKQIEAAWNWSLGKDTKVNSGLDAADDDQCSLNWT